MRPVAEAPITVALDDIGKGVICASLPKVAMASTEAD